MVNMSYCRFHNTLLALRECKNHLIDMSMGGEDPLSGDEKEACISLAQESISFLRDLLENEVDRDDLNIWAFTSSGSTDLIIGAVDSICEQAANNDEDEDVRQGK